MSIFARLTRGPVESSIKAIKGGTAGVVGHFRLQQIYQNPNQSSRVHSLYHGTCKEKMGDQIEKGVFENRGRKIYGDTMETALTYATQRGTPIVLEITSDQKVKHNEIATDGGWGWGLGYFPFFHPDEAPVKILKCYAVQELPAPKK